MIDALKLEGRGEDPFFVHVVAMAKRIFGAPVAFISLMGTEEQRFLHIDGIEMAGTPRTHSMCAYTVAARRPVILPDTHADPRFRDHPIVTGPPHVRFSASAPVILSSGFCLGTVCAVDLVPHDAPKPEQVEQLVSLATMVARFYEMPLIPDPMLLERAQEVTRNAHQSFLDLIGHELRTPLNGILGLASCLAPVDREEEQVVSALRSAAEHLDAIIGSILSFTELSSGDIGLEESRIAPTEIVRRSIETLEGQMVSRGKSLRLSSGPAVSDITADGSKLQLALTCLLNNVLAHGGDKAEVALAEVAGGGIAIRVTDDGTGIEDSRRDAIWEVFTVGEDVRRRRAEGLGLGLPLTRRIAEMHGGDVTVGRSETGFEVVLSLPAWRSVAA